MTPLATILARMAENRDIHPIVRAAIRDGMREPDERLTLATVAEKIIDEIARDKIEGRRTRI